MRRLASGGPYEDAVGYSRAVVVPDGLGRVLVSGCTGVRPDPAAPGDARQQADAALDAVERALLEAGSDLGRVVRTRMYVVDREDCAAVGEVHARRLGAARPAATMVVVSGLIDPRMRVEIEAEAVLEPAPRVGEPGA